MWTMSFITHAKDDKTAPISFAVAIDEKIKQLGVPERLFVVETGGHGAFHYGVVEGPGAKWPEALLPWLKQMEMMK
jgi:hypothetical protein